MYKAASREKRVQRTVQRQFLTFSRRIVAQCFQVVPLSTDTSHVDSELRKSAA